MSTPHTGRNSKHFKTQHVKHWMKPVFGKEEEEEVEKKTDALEINEKLWTNFVLNSSAKKQKINNFFFFLAV